MPTSPSPHRAVKPLVAGKAGSGTSAAAARAPAATRSLWPFALLVFALTALAVVISALPASVAARFLPAAVHAEDFSGTVWHGSAARITIKGRDAGALEWHLHPIDLLRMHVTADWHWVKRGFVLDGAVDADRSQATASHVQGGGPIEDLADLGLSQGWRGIAEVHVRQLKTLWSGDSAILQSAVGEIAVANVTARQIADGADLGGYVLRFANPQVNAGSDASAELADTGGPLALQATIQFSMKERRGMLSGTLQERSAAAPALRRLLDDLGHMHARDAEGRIPIDVEFTL